ncbi:MAG: hypothetical protein NVSMB19_11790 [Vulcanimicrobiaceae bacterium]
MRRLALSVFTVCGLALLSACGSGGGYGFSTSDNANGSIDQVVFTAGRNAQANSFIVSPTGNTPLEVDAIGQKGTGPFAVVVPDATFTWAARFVDPTKDNPPVSNYTVGPNASSKPCPKKPSTTPAIPILQQTLPGVYPVSAALTPSQAARTVFIAAPAGMSAADNATGYCIVLQATHVGDGKVGAATVLVSNNP